MGNMKISGKAALGAVFFAAINAAWLYVFSFMKFGFLDLFDYAVFMKLMDLTLIFLVIIIGLLVAASISVVLYATGESKKDELLLFGAAGGASAVIAYIMFNSVFGLLFMLFFVAGCLLAIGTKPLQVEGTFAKLKTGWGAAKKVMLVFAIGAFLTSLLFVFANKTACEENAKNSLVQFSLKSVSGGLNLQGLISKDDIKNMMCGSITRESVEPLLKAQMGDGWDALSADAKEDLINKTYTQSINNCNNDEYINQAYNTMQEKLSGGNMAANAPMIEKLIEGLPIMKLLMQFLPLISAFVLFSAINLLGMIFVNPFTALLSLRLPKKGGEKEENKEKEADSKQASE